MDDIQQFLLHGISAKDAAHFELRYSDDQRPFHLSFPAGARQFMITEMTQGHWGRAASHPLPAGSGGALHHKAAQHAAQRLPVLVHRQGLRVAVFAGNAVAVWTIPQQQMRSAWPQPAAAGLTWQELAPARRAHVTWPADTALPRLHALPLPGGLDLALPDPPATGMVLQVFDELRVHAAPLLQHAATCPAPLAIIALDAPGCGLLLARLLPGVPLLIAQPSTIHGAEETATLAQAAGLPCQVMHADHLTEAQIRGALVVGLGVTSRAWPGAAGVYDLAAGSVSGTGMAPSVSQAAATPATAPDRVQGLDVVVSLYNTRDLVCTCLDSLVDPSRSDIRFLVIDDGSTDGSGDLVAQRYAGMAQVQVLKKANGGCASARNYGRLVSDRTHIAFVDADDMAEPGFFGALLDLARGTGAELVQGSFDFLDPGRTPARWPYGDDLALMEAFAQETIGGETVMRIPPHRLLRSQPSVWRMVFQRAFLDAHDIWFPESIRAYDDFLFHLRCMLHARSLFMAPGRKYLYRQHPGQDIRQRDARHFGNLAMCATLIRSQALASNGAAATPLHQAVFDVIDWSTQHIAPELLGAFLSTAADLCVTLENLPGGSDLVEPMLATVRHPDFAPFLAKARARVAPMPAGDWWRWTEPALVHPGTVQQQRAQQGTV
ncbi:MAG: glycosyltransferase [Pararhodobacter sp.]|nr:glycosyltransferase [Pararhodobacter sp.]